MRNWGAALLLAMVLMGLAVTAGYGHVMDARLMNAMALRRGVSADNAILAAQWISWIGNGAFPAILALAGAGWLIWKKRPRAAAIFYIFYTAEWTGHTALKAWYGRPRPDISPHLDVFGNAAYPSGHAATAMGIMLLSGFFLWGRQWLIPGVILAIAIGISRVLLGVHWPSDVLGGWFFGAGIACLAAWVAELVESKA